MKDGDADKGTLTRAEMTRPVPAARCRGCGVVTWTVTIAAGLKRSTRKHEEGCGRPPGRLDILAKVPLSERERFLGGALERPMTQDELEALAYLLPEED